MLNIQNIFHKIEINEKNEISKIVHNVIDKNILIEELDNESGFGFIQSKQ